MSDSIYGTIIRAVGSLPFWTGKRKLIRFLAGETGSFWEKKSPLKRIYLDQRFFGALSEETSSTVRQHVQKLQQSDYLYRGQISEDKPYQVVKFTDKGARKFYNTLVMEEGLEEPLWWLHHAAQLESDTNSPISTGGQILRYNDTYYLTQTPPHAPVEERIKEEKTLPVLSRQDLDFDEGNYRFSGLRIHRKQGTRLIVTEETDWTTSTPKDIQEKLSHYDTAQSQVAPPNPYVIQGELTSVEPGDETNTWLELTLTNREDATLPVYVKRNQVPDELELSEGTRYTLGPLEEYDHETTPEDRFELRLEDDGEIREERL